MQTQVVIVLAIAIAFAAGTYFGYRLADDDNRKYDGFDQSPA
ncbi:MAG: hypothetical protein ACPG77_10100 [Nannocystaceae bacterium]